METEISEKLGRSLRRLFRKTRTSSRASYTAFDVSAGCAFGAVLEERLKNMEGHIEELKGRINGLIFLLVGTVLVEVVMRFMG